MPRKILRFTRNVSMRLSPQSEVQLATLAGEVKRAGVRLLGSIIRGATVDVLVEAACRVAVRHLPEMVNEVQTILAIASNEDAGEDQPSRVSVG